MGDVLHEEGAGAGVGAAGAGVSRASRRGGQVQARPERGKLCH